MGITVGIPDRVLDRGWDRGWRHDGMVDAMAEPPDELRVKMDYLGMDFHILPLEIP